MLSAHYVSLKNGMRFSHELFVVSGSGTVEDHALFLKHEYKHDFVANVLESNEIQFGSLRAVCDQMGLKQVNFADIVFVNKD